MALKTESAPKDAKEFETLMVWKQSKAALVALKDEISEGTAFSVTLSPLLEQCVEAYREKHGLKAA